MVVDALDRIGRDAQAHVAAERVGHEGDVGQVRQNPRLLLILEWLTYLWPPGRSTATKVNHLEGRAATA
jgi:hypothetical protein